MFKSERYVMIDEQERYLVECASDVQVPILLPGHENSARGNALPTVKNPLSGSAEAVTVKVGPSSFSIASPVRKSPLLCFFLWGLH